MNIRHAIILFDIDNTLINFSQSCPIQDYLTDQVDISIAWTGGTYKIWLDNINLLKQTAAEHGLELHIGISTYKKTYHTEDNKKNNRRGDYISAAILEDETYINAHEYHMIKGLGAGLGLKEILNYDLIYFTSAQSKVTHSLEPARAHIQNKYSVDIHSKHVVLIDDQSPACELKYPHEFTILLPTLFQ
ncbi:MAG: hypothetical protein P4M12_11010 [Gammaproteobacteria bacterium]|nr:hypothetical protein [Gammaproteobacteria bacterium]